MVRSKDRDKYLSNVAVMEESQRIILIYVITAIKNILRQEKVNNLP